ncbi:MAG: hypothetical protein JW894_00990 [Bacteroidales bacterium]|nr:hypothetical protein [Bacteroidales bacterium]
MYRTLLLCKDNSVFTPMAYGYFKSILKKDQSEIYCAGIINKKIDQLILKVMLEDNIDISDYKPHLLPEFKSIDFDYVLTFDAESEEQSHHLPSKTVKYHYDFDKLLIDNGKAEERLENLRIVRERIKKTVRSFIKEHFTNSAVA